MILPNLSIASILTVPVIMDKMNDVINFLLPLPALGSIAVGINLRTHAELGVSHDWMSRWFIVAGICQCVVMPFGIGLVFLFHDIDLTFLSFQLLAE